MAWSSQLDLLIKIYILMSLLKGFIFSDPIKGDNKKVSTFIILKSGDSVRVKKLDASFAIQPMIKFDIELFDFDNLSSHLVFQLWKLLS